MWLPDTASFTNDNSPTGHLEGLAVKWFRVRTIAHKEFLHIRRDGQSLAGAIAIPVLLLMIFGWGLSLDVNYVPMVVWDQSQSPASRELVQRFSASRYFRLAAVAGNYDAVEDAIDSRAAIIGLVIPRDFSAAIEKGRPVQVQVIVDGSDANTGILSLGYAEGVVAEYSDSVAVQRVQPISSHPQRGTIDLKSRAWFNANLESRNYLVPGLMAILMTVIAALLTSLTVAREWERGTMEPLIATPVAGTELIAGKLLPYIAIGAVDMTLAVAMAKFLFHIPFRGSGTLLVVLSSVFLIGAFAMGMLVSINSRTQVVANQQAIVFTFLPALLLSGFVYAIANMPMVIRGFAYMFPVTYFVKALRVIYLKGVGLEGLWLEATMLLIFAAALLLLANSRFRKSLD